jgi:MFS family permease
MKRRRRSVSQDSELDQRAVRDAGSLDGASTSAASAAAASNTPGARGLTRHVTPVRARLIRSAGAVFWLMFLINVVNYLDRFVAAAVGPTLKFEFNLRDDQIGMLSTAFLLVYTVAGLPLGVLADRASRARIVAIGVGIWSLFSGYTAFARGFGELFLSRVGVGIGESSYLPAGTALLSAYNPPEKRARVMSRWGSGQLVGIALAFAVSSLLFKFYDQFTAWRVAFLITAIPGFFLALAMWFVADSPRDIASPSDASAKNASGHLTLSYEGGWDSPQRVLRGVRAIGLDLWRHIRAVWSIPTLRVAVVLQALYFVVVTPAVIFLPIYIASKHGPFDLPTWQVTAVSGAMLVLGGLSGALVGGNIADWLGRRYEGSRVLIAALGTGVGLPCYVVTLLTHSLVIFIVLGTAAIFAFTIWVGPLTAAVQDATPPALRGTAIAVMLLLAHLGGDIWSPSVVGFLSTALHDRTGLALLIVGIPALALATIVAFRGAKIHAADVAAQSRARRARKKGAGEVSAQPATGTAL